MATGTKKTMWLMLKDFTIRFLIVVIYAFAGAAIFMRIETPKGIENTETNCSTGSTNWSMAEFVNETRQKLAMNVSAAKLKEIADEMLNFASKACDDGSSTKQQTLAERYNIWLYFSFVTIMTIGYGDVTPKTNEGKILVIVFSIIGIPLMLWLLSLSGQIQTAILRKLVQVGKNSIRKARNKNLVEVKNSDGAITIAAVVFAIIAHFVGAFAVRRRTEWTLIDCIYFWFCTSTTIGYGDLTLKPKGLAHSAYWLLIKLFTLAQMAGLINTVLCWLEARQVEKIREKTKKLSQNVRKKRSFKLSDGFCENGFAARDIELEDKNYKGS